MDTNIRERVYAATQYKREREYWIEKLSGDIGKKSFSSSIMAQSGTIRITETLQFQLPLPLFNRLMEIVNNSDSRLHIALITALNILLHKYTGNIDIIIGTPIDKQDVEGEFINTILPLRNSVDPMMSVKELLMKIKQTVIDASENQNYPIETLPNELGLESDDAQFPLFDTGILLQNIQDKSYFQQIKLNMIFSFFRTDDSIDAFVEYNAAVFDKNIVQQIIDHFIHITQGAFFSVNSKIMDIPLLTQDEMNSLVFDFNNTPGDYPKEKMIHHLFEEQSARTPNNVAVESKTILYTYKELNEKANRLARVFRENGIGPDSVIAIMLESSAEIPLAIFSVLKAGGIYLPMGFEYPEDRINYVLKDSNAKQLITRKELIAGKSIDCKILDIEDESLFQGNSENLTPVDQKDNLVYVIYTSGTTGQPKGVMIEHKGLVNYTWWAARLYVNNEHVDFPLYTSISFDLTVTSIFTPLITGNRIIVYGGIDKKLYLEEVIEDNRVGIIKLTPSHLKLIRSKIVKNSSIKRLIVGGEELETQLALDISNNFDNKIEIYNEYGPTETVVGSMIYRFNPETETRLSVPIGKPISNTRIYLLNSFLQPVPPMVVGEIFIGGDGLARGYLFNSKMTQEKFLPDPFIEGQKMYKTGDLAVRLPDGNIEYKGRSDHQVKIRGHRVETAEIEAKIIEFQKFARTRREQRENIVEKMDLEALNHCKTCLIPENYPGIHFDENGICEICNEFEVYKDKAFAYFKTPDEFRYVIERARQTKNSQYDCLMLYSGGKDSSYVLHRLVEMGLKVLAFTFDNGYISAKAFENIARTTKLLNVDHITLDLEAMKEIFVESLWSDYNVCNGCFKAVNTLGTKVAHDHNINLVVSGLTRGQIFDIKLHGLFKLGVFDEETIEERLTLFRKNYHSMTHRTSRLIGVEISNEKLDKTYFVDFFRYDKISTHNIFEYLRKKDKEWVRPTDTGASSSNCIINDVGIYVHLKDKGCHFYAPQLSWDCRLGTISRDEGLEEMWGYKVDHSQTIRVLNEIGYFNAFTGAVVLDWKDERGEKSLCAYILADKEFDVSELKTYLSQELPDYMIPTYYMKIDRIPLASSGKVDRKALPKPELSLEEEYVAPRNPVEEKLTDVWAEVLGLKKEKIGIDANFFEVGGHSLRATFLAASVQKYFDVRLPLVKIFELPTIRGQAELIGQTRKEVFTAIPKIEHKNYYALSSGQRRLYILQQMNVNNTAYNIPEILPLSIEPDPVKIEDTLKKLIKRHESLRTSFQMLDNTPVQIVHDEVDFKLGVYHISNSLDSSDCINQLVRPFDLSQAPLIRAALINTTYNNRCLLAVDMHHIISDGVSHHILIDDFRALYDGEELSPLHIQYKDYSEWQIGETGNLKRQEEFWLTQFEEEPPVLELPNDYPRPVHQSFEGNTIRFKINADQTLGVKAIALSENSTLFMVLTAIYTIFLSKLSGQEDIVIGTPVAGRRHADLEKIIGMFVNTLPLRNFPTGNQTFKQFLGDVKERSLMAFENQEYPFEELVDKLSLKRNMGRNPLFDVMFSLQNMTDGRQNNESDHETSSQNQPVSEDEFENAFQTVKFDLTLTSMEYGREIYFAFQYCTKLFKKETMERFIVYFKEVLSIAIANPDIRLGEIDILSDEEKRHILIDLNDTQAENPMEKPLHLLFGEQVERVPDTIAVVGPSVDLPQHITLQFTYKLLQERSDRLASVLRSKGVTHDTIVGINIERSIEMVIGLLGILKAGGAYLPIALDYPQDRIDYILNDSGAVLVLNAKAIHDMCLYSEDIQEQTGTNSIKYTQSPATCLAYVIYTSGTTGQPKGVLVEHKNIVNTVTWFTHLHNLGTGTRIVQVSDYTFDASINQIFGALTSGASLYIVMNQTRADIISLRKFILTHRINIINFVPSLLKELLGYGEKLDSLHTVISGAEKLDDDTKENIRSKGYRLVNQYGPTEATIDALAVECTPEKVSIGKPILNVNVFIVGIYREILPLGVPGELYIAGAGVARGYLNQAELTFEKFVPASFINHVDELPITHLYPTLYRTGDLARWLPDGNVEFLGRIDQQVKIRGFRIELGEIESPILEIDGVKEAVVIPVEEESGNMYLCAYYVSRRDYEIAELRLILSKRLPDYMIPSFFVRIEAIPLTSNGKIDRKSLPKPETMLAPSEDSRPPNEVEDILIGIWSGIAGIAKDKIAIEKSLFDLGGNSLNLILLMSGIHRQFEKEVPLVRIFENPTIKDIALIINSENFADSPVMLLNRPTEKKLFLFPPLIAYGVSYRELAALITDYSFYAFYFIEEEDRMEQYVKSITEIQPEGPYTLVGYSAAGKLTFQVAKELEKHGHEVSDIIFIECFYKEDHTPIVSEEDLKRNAEFMGALLEEWGLPFLKDKVIRKSEKYIEYFRSINRLEKIDSTVHLLLTEEFKKREDPPDPKCWDILTSHPSLIYDGYGTHDSALDPGTVERNAEVFSQILNRIEAKRQEKKLPA